MSTESYDVSTIEGRTTLWVDSSRAGACLKYYVANRINCLGINYSRGYGAKDFEFLRDQKNIEALAIVFPPALTWDVTPIKTLRSLRSLTLSRETPLSPDDFPQLTEFRGQWDSAMRFSNSENLTVLSLTGYKPKTKDFSGFPRVPSLRDLALIQSNLHSLQGVSQLKGLRRLELAYLTKLESLVDVNHLQSLEVLDCQKCRRLNGHDVVRHLSQLRVLRFNDCGEMPSIAFVNSLERLEEFRFVNTNVLDGDLRPLLRLMRVGFLRKKHYSHTPEEIDEILRPKGGSAVARLE